MLQTIALGSGRREACALLAGTATSQRICIRHIVAVRNTRRLRHSFGIAAADLAALGSGLVGVFHTHATSCTPSSEDFSVFDQCASLRLQVIGALTRGALRCCAYDRMAQEVAILWH